MHGFTKLLTVVWNTHRPVGQITAGLQLCMLGITVNHHPLEVELRGHGQMMDSQPQEDNTKECLTDKCT